MKKRNKKSHYPKQLNIRLDDYTFYKLKALSSNCNMSLSSFVRYYLSISLNGGGFNNGH